MKLQTCEILKKPPPPFKSSKGNIHTLFWFKINKTQMMVTKNYGLRKFLLWKIVELEKFSLLKSCQVRKILTLEKLWSYKNSHLGKLWSSKKFHFRKLWSQKNYVNFGPLTQRYAFWKVHFLQGALFRRCTFHKVHQINK